MSRFLFLENIPRVCILIFEIICRSITSPDHQNHVITQRYFANETPCIYIYIPYDPYGPYGPYGPLRALRPLRAKSARGGG